MLSQDEENNTHLTLQGKITIHVFLVAQTSLTMSMPEQNL